jgi:23S rRNA (pseudouridine1915-N3)-methyltransferase
MRLLIAAVGRLKDGPERILCQRYVERANAAGRAVGLAPVEIREVREGAKRAPRERLAEEGKGLSALVPAGARVFVLDAGGRNLTSEQFAETLARLRSQNVPAAVFQIGGPDGLAPALRDRAHMALAFGAATIPHQLARILLAEQLYRAITILSGHPYHRG